MTKVFNQNATLPLTAGCYSQPVKVGEAVAMGQGVQSKPIAPQLAVTNIVRLTQAQYNALAVKDPDTLYLVTA